MFNSIIKMFSSKGNFVRRDKNFPNIIYLNGILKKEINNWVNDMNVGTFNEILRDIGFKNDDCVYLYGVDNMEIHYSVNNEKLNENNVISLSYGNIGRTNSEIIIIDGSGKRTYGIGELSDNNIFLKSYEYLLDSGMICKKSIDGDKVLFTISNNDYELMLEIVLNLENGYFLSDLEMLNSKRLEEYMINLKFPVIIEDVYKKINEILEIDQSMFRLFNLVVTKKVNRMKTDIVLDEILIRDGMFERIIKSYEYGTINLDRNGNWSYNKFDGDLVFSVRYDNNSRYRYNFDDKDSNNKCLNGEELYELKDDAGKSVEDTKKLVRMMFNR